MADAQIKAVITAEDKASATLKKFKDNLSGVSDFMGGAFEDATRVAAVGFGALVAGAVTSVKAFEESQNVLAQLDAVLASTHGSAGVAKQSVINLSKQLEHLTGVSDETILNSENVLLTFTKVGKTVFPSATKAALDMATALNHGVIPDMQTLQDRTQLLGKALQDPDKGLGALHRVGVNVDELKKKFNDSMSVEDKQKLILQELSTEYGGAAEAAGKTLGGQLDILKQNVNDVQEGIGGFINQSLTPLVSWLNKVIEKIDWSQATDTLKKKLTELKDGFVAFTDPIKDFIEKHRVILLDFFDKFGKVAIVIIPIMAALALAWTVLSSPLFIIIGALTLTWELWEKHRGLFVILVGAILGGLIPALGAIATTIYTTVIPALVEAVVPILPFIVAGAAVAGLAYLIISHWSGISKFFSDLWSGITASFKSAINWIIGGLNTVIKAADNVTSHLPGGSHLSIPEIPKLAEGGIVTRPTIAMIGEAGPEAIVPLGKSNAMGQVNITIQAGAYMGNPSDARKYAQLIVDNIKDIAGKKNMTGAELLA